MSIATEITRIQGAKASLKTSIEAKGVSVPSATKIDGYSALVDSIQQGGSSDWDKVEITTDSLTTTVDAFYSAYIQTFAEQLTEGYALMYFVTDNSDHSYSTRFGMYTYLGGALRRWDIRQNSSTVQNASGTSSFRCVSGAKVTIYISKSAMMDIWS